MINADLYHGLASLHGREFPSISLKQDLNFVQATNILQ